MILNFGVYITTVEILKPIKQIPEIASAIYSETDEEWLLKFTRAFKDIAYMNVIFNKLNIDPKFKTIISGIKIEFLHNIAKFDIPKNTTKYGVEQLLIVNIEKLLVPAIQHYMGVVSSSERKMITNNIQYILDIRKIFYFYSYGLCNFFRYAKKL